VRAVVLGLLLAIPASTAGGASSPGYELRRVARAVGPVLVVAAPGEAGTLYVVERRGLVRTLVRGRLRPTPFLDIRGTVSTAGERGLLSLAFPPDYGTSRRAYALYTDRGGDVTLTELRVESGRATTARVLAVAPHGDSLYHNGGHLAFGPDGRLYLSIGDGGYLGRTPDPNGNSQNLDVLLGKLARVDPDRADARPEVVAYGLRNPWRFSFDRSTGDLLIGDVGWNGAEEVNLLPRGETELVNFGWSVYEGRRRRSTDVVLDGRGRLAFPLLTYLTHVRGNCSIVGGYVYRGRALRALRGRYVYGDYCTGRIWSVRIAAGRASDNRVEPVRVPRLVSFGEDAAGELYAVSLGGAVYRFVPRRP
jgi:glucose/arabinose dehydrogenase